MIRYPLQNIFSRHILHRYANEDVSLGSWFIGLDVEHIDDRSLCCGTPPGESYIYIYSWVIFMVSFSPSCFLLRIGEKKKKHSLWHLLKSLEGIFTVGIHAGIERYIVYGETIARLVLFLSLENKSKFQRFLFGGKDFH